MIIEFSIIVLSAVRQNLISLFTTICLPCSCFRCLIWRNDKLVNYNSFEFSWRLFKEVILAGNCTNWWVSIYCVEEELNGECIISFVKRFPDIKQIDSNKKEEEKRVSRVENQDNPFTLWFSSHSLDSLTSKDGRPTRESKWLKDWCHYVIPAHFERRRMFIFHSSVPSGANWELLSLFRYIWMRPGQSDATMRILFESTW